MDYYELLGLKPGATRKEIKKAYKAMAAKSHPDKKTGNAETHKALTVAYNVLADPDKRNQYDKTGNASQAKPRERWETALLSLFNTLILQKFKGDYVREAKGRLINAVTENQARKSQHEQEARAYRKKLGRVKGGPEGPNLFDGLLTQKIEVAETDAKLCFDEIEALAMAIVKVDKYTDTAPDDPDGPPTGHYITKVLR